MNDKAKIGSLWIGGPLSWLEIASIKSFLETGHDYTLYSYENIPNVPEGATQADAREVWDTDRIVLHGKSNSPATHADIFRVKMVAKTGKVWADTDIIALRPFPASMEYFLGHERDDKLLLGNAILGMPASSPTLQAMLAFLEDDAPVPPWFPEREQRTMQKRREAGDPVGFEDLPWGTTGPQALTYFAEQTGELDRAQPPGVFFPIGFTDRKRLVEPKSADGVARQIEEEQSLCVHLYSRWMRKFTSRLPLELPRRRSWMGNYLNDHGLAEYPQLTEAQEKALNKEKTRKRRENDHKVDAKAFFADLSGRRKKIPGGANESRHGQVTLVTMAKDEGPYVLEWVAYHHLLGFTDILVYTNDCTDGTDEMLDALAELGLLTRMQNGPLDDKPPQSRALIRADDHPLVTRSDWTMVMDFDEFLSIKTEGGDVDSLIDVIEAQNAGAMSVTWRFFGSAGKVRYEDAPVTQRLTRAASDSFTRGFGVKTLFRNEPHLRLAIHRPQVGKRKDLDIHDLSWINGSGLPIDGKVMTWRQTRETAGYDLAQVNHYGVKTAEEFLMRRLRGDVLNNHSKYDAEYFRTYDRNEIEDLSALRIAEDLDRLMKRLRRHKAVAEAEKLVRARYEEKLQRLRTSEGYDHLLSELAEVQAA